MTSQGLCNHILEAKMHILYCKISVFCYYPFVKVPLDTIISVKYTHYSFTIKGMFVLIEVQGLIPHVVEEILFYVFYRFTGGLYMKYCPMADGLAACMEVSKCLQSLLW